MSVVALENNISSVDIEKELSKIFSLSSYKLEKSKKDHFTSFRKAFEPILTYNKDNLVLFETYKVGHDGYDRHGPESYLWDLCYLVKTLDGKIYYQEWHGENWFCGPWDFELVETFEVKDRASIAHFIEKIHRMTENLLKYYLDEFSEDDFKKYDYMCPDGIFISLGNKMEFDKVTHFAKKGMEKYAIFAIECNTSYYDKVKMKYKFFKV